MVSPLSIDDTVIRAAVAEAVLKTLPPETRDQMIRDSLKAILLEKPKGNSYHDPSPSIIEAAFRDAAGALARKIVTAELEENPVFKTKVKEIVSEVCERAFNGEVKGKIVSEISGAVEKAFSNVRGY